MKILGILLMLAGAGLIYLFLASLFDAGGHLFRKLHLLFFGVPGFLLVWWGKNCLTPAREFENEN